MQAAMVAVVLLLAAVTASAQKPTFNTGRQVTIVMKGGARHGGTLVYHNNDYFNLIQNGREIRYPIASIAAVEFVAGAPPAAEIAKLPAGTPPELRRHMVVLTDGAVMHCKLYTIKTDALTVDMPDHKRTDIALDRVARLYMDGAAARAIFK